MQLTPFQEYILRPTFATSPAQCRDICTMYPMYLCSYVAIATVVLQSTMYCNVFRLALIDIDLKLPGLVFNYIRDAKFISSIDSK